MTSYRAQNPAYDLLFNKIRTLRAKPRKVCWLNYPELSRDLFLRKGFANQLTFSTKMPERINSQRN